MLRKEDKNSAYGCVFGGRVQAVHVHGQSLVTVQGQTQGFDLGPGSDAGVQLTMW